ncbi:MAG: hypothetical protein IPK10_05545 [Bacteroidetes bacterium]|nr:hypothetical protein [Bacteroidota bacterium]
MEVVKVDVMDSVIVAFYYDKWILVQENRDTTWHIIIPGKEKAYRFENEEKFSTELSKFTNGSPNFREVSDLWVEFKEKGYLNWFPEEYKE